jgi:general secretion pathway protein D
MRNLFKILIAGLVLASAPAQAQEHVINYRDAEIQAFIDDVSALTGYTFIVGPNVRGAITITSDTPMTSAEVFQTFLSTMRAYGFAVLPTASGAYQILPEQNAARTGGPVTNRLRGDQYVTAVERLDHVSVRDALSTLRPMVSQTGFLNAAEGANVLVIADTAENVARIRAVIDQMDRDNSVHEMVALQNVSASEMARIIENVRSRQASGEDDTLFGVTVAPIPSSNTILLRGARNAVQEMARLVAEVDQVSESNQSFRVVYLNHAEGEGLLPILEQVATTLGGDGPGARRASVSHHAPTNALIINADPDIQREMELVIRQLDIRRPQVLVEAIIVEISDTAARELGVQFLLAGTEGDSPLVTTRYSNTNPDLLALTGALSGVDGDEQTSTTLRSAALGSLLGVNGLAAGFGGQDGDGNLFGLILNAVDTDTDSNVLSTPSILTLDNQDAMIMVGQEIPITTGEVLGANNANPFRTIERQNVGVQLDVRPQINEGDTIRLFIRQEVSSVFGPVSQASSELITNTREITTTVLADDGEIVVLGGLIEQDDQYAEDGVPGLNRLPGVGRLFRSEGRSSGRRNLMVFIRPTIIRSEEDMRAVTDGRYGYITNEQRLADPNGDSSLEALMDVLMSAPERAGSGDN